MSDRICRLALLAVCLSAPLVGPVLAEGDGPDWFRVTGVASDDVLNVREAPGARQRKVGELPHDADGVRNLGCVGGLSFTEWQLASAAERENAARSRWCRVAWRNVEGWSSARFLAEGSPPTPENVGNGGDGMRGEPAQFVAMRSPCVEQAGRLTGAPVGSIEILDEIRTGGGPILTLSAAGAKYTCRLEESGDVTVFSEYAN